jgi:hypothetical protein
MTILMKIEIFNLCSGVLRAPGIATNAKAQGRWRRRQRQATEILTCGPTDEYKLKSKRVNGIWCVSVSVCVGHWMRREIVDDVLQILKRLGLQRATATLEPPQKLKYRLQITNTERTRISYAYGHTA